VVALNSRPGKLIVSLDGKIIRGSGSKCEGRKAKHIVSTFAGQLRMVFGETATDKERNEIKYYCNASYIIGYSSTDRTNQQALPFG
jgi:hypothetical protein